MIYSILQDIMVWYIMIFVLLRLTVHKDATNKCLDRIQPNLKKIKFLEVNAWTICNRIQPKCLVHIEPINLER